MRSTAPFAVSAAPAEAGNDMRVEASAYTVAGHCEKCSLPIEIIAAIGLWLIDGLVEIGVGIIGCFLEEENDVEDQLLIVGSVAACLVLLLLILEIVQVVRILRGKPGAVRAMVLCLIADLLVMGAFFVPLGNGSTLWDWFFPTAPIYAVVIALLLSSRSRRWVAKMKESESPVARGGISVHMKIALAMLAIIVLAFAGMLFVAMVASE